MICLNFRAGATALALLLVLAQAAPSLAQNQPDYFKVRTDVAADAPSWQQLMYSADPNVLDVEDAYEAYYREHAWSKDIHVRNYIYWRRAVDGLLDETGHIRPPAPEAENAAFEAWRSKPTKSASAARSTDDWRPIGPFATYHTGRGGRLTSLQANVFCLSVYERNPNVLFAGTEGSGVYRTSNAGQEWELCTADQPFSRGVSAIAIHPTNVLIVLVAANRRFYRTDDAGDNWTEVEFIDGTGYEFKYHPTEPNIVFATTSQGLYRSSDAGATWVRQNTRASYDLEWKPGSTTQLYLYDHDAASNRSVVRTSRDGGATWTIADNGWYVPANPSEAIARGGKLAVTPSAPDLVYASVISDGKAGDNGWIGLYHSADGGATWQNPAPRDGAPYDDANAGHWNVAAYSSGYHQGFYNHDLEVSPTDPDKLWMGTVRLVETTDRGATWLGIGAANSQRLDDQHADIQDLEIGADGRVWIASDGGVDVSDDELADHHEARIYGLDAADYWGFAGGWNEDLLVGGKYHNGNGVHYQTYATGDFAHVSGVEEPTGYVNPYYPRRALFRHWYGEVTLQQEVPLDVRGTVRNLANMVMAPYERVGQSDGSTLAADVRYGEWVYLGRDDKLWASRDGGASFGLSFTFPDGDQIAQFE